MKDDTAKKKPAESAVVNKKQIKLAVIKWRSGKRSPKKKGLYLVYFKETPRPTCYENTILLVYYDGKEFDEGSGFMPNFWAKVENPYKKRLGEV